MSRPRRIVAAVGVTAIVAALVTVVALPASAAATPLSNVVLQVVPVTPTDVASTVGNPSDNGVPQASDSAVTLQYGQGNAYRLKSFDVGTNTYSILPTTGGHGYAEVFRVDNPQVSGNRQSIFDVRASASTPFNQLVSNDPTNLTEGQVLSSGIVTQGSDNTFANASGTLTINNIERISFMRTNALAASDTSSVGLTLVERGGNDPFQLAAVTAVDASGNPTAWGPMVAYAKDVWGTGTSGTVLASVASTVFRKDPADAHYRPTTTTGAQKLAGVYIPLSDLSVAAGQSIYGISIFPADATAPNSNFSLTTDGTNQGGIDLVGGVFATSKPPTAVDVVKTGKQGATQTLPLNSAAGDIRSPLDTTQTVLIAPSTGTLSTDGTVVTVPGEGTYTLNRSANTVSFVPLSSFSGAATPVGYTVTDIQGSTATAALDPTVTAVTPVAKPDTTTGKQNVAQSINPLSNDVAGDSSVPLVPTTVTLLKSGAPTSTIFIPGQGTYSTASGKLVFTPIKTFVGTATPASYRVSDSNGTTAQSTYTPTVTAVTPTAQNDSSTGIQGAQQKVNPLTNDLAGDAGAALDPSTLTLLDASGTPVSSVTIPNQGTYTIVSGEIVFTPVKTFVGTATAVTYRVADSNGTTTTATYAPTATAVTPVTKPDNSTGAQGDPQRVNPLTNDKPGDATVPLVASTLTLVDGSGNPVTSVTIPGQGTYTIDNGDIVFTPVNTFTGTSDPVTYRVTDTNGTNATGTSTATVTPVTPTAKPDVSNGPQGIAQSVDPLANDELGSTNSRLDPASLTLFDKNGAPATSVTIAGQGEYTVDNGHIVFTPVKTFTGTADAVVYQVSDENGETSASTYTATLDAVTPTAVADATSGEQGAVQTVSPLANDTAGSPDVALDKSTLTLLTPAGTAATSVTVSGQGTYRIVNDTIEFTPVRSFVGQATAVRYRVADANGTTASSTYTPTVTAVNPAAHADTSTGPQGIAQSVDPLQNDVPGTVAHQLDPSTLTLLTTAGAPVATVTITGQGVYSISNDKIVFTPTATFVGDATPVSYRVADDNGTTTMSHYTPTLVAVTPTAKADNTSGQQSEQQSVKPLANDTAGNSAVPLDAASLTLLDAAGDPATSVTTAGQGTYTVSGDTVTFTPIATFIGVADGVRYRVADSNGTTATARYTPTVSGVNPAAAPDASTGIQGAVQSVDPLANDTVGTAGVKLDPSTLTLLTAAGVATASVTIADQGVYTIKDGDIVFTPTSGFTGTATPVDYRVADESGQTATSHYTPTVTPIAPTANADTTSGLQGHKQSVNPFGNDTAGNSSVPLDTTSLTLLDAANAAVSSVTITGQGVYTVAGNRIEFTPTATFLGTANPVTYRIADANGTTATSTYTPTVTAPGPTAVADATTGPQGAKQSIDPLANDTVVDGGPALQPSTLTLLTAAGDPASSITIAGQGTYRVSDGRIVFTPVAAFVGVATPVTYRIADTNGTTATAQYTPTVTTVAPVANPDATSGPRGVRQHVKPLVNDAPGAADVPLEAPTLTLLNANGTPVRSLTVAGEGKYTVANGVIVFAPLQSFVGPATPVAYRVSDANGTSTTSTYTPTVTATPSNVGVIESTKHGHQGDAVPIDPNEKVKGLVPGSVEIVAPNGDLVTTLVVAGEGEWTVNPLTGVVTFTPESGYVGDPEAISIVGVTDSGESITGTLRAIYDHPLSLAFTGVSVGGVSSLAALLLLVGGGVLLLARRRARQVGRHRA